MRGSRLHGGVATIKLRLAPSSACGSNVSKNNAGHVLNLGANLAYASPHAAQAQIEHEQLLLAHREG